jgi:hypothetical protein
LVTAIVEALPNILMALIDSFPIVLEAITAAIPEIIASVIGAIPDIVVALIQAIPTLLTALFTELIPGLTVAVATATVEFFVLLGRFFADLITEIAGFISNPFDKDKRPVTATFGDTPGVIKAGASGLSARFAAGDYVVAAQDPFKLISNAMSMMAGGISPGSMEIPSVSRLAEAVLQSGSAVGSAGGAGQALQVKVTAEGRTLDEVLYVGSKRGTTPRIKSMMRKSTQAGAHVGFDRGRYSPAS